MSSRKQTSVDSNKYTNIDPSKLDDCTFFKRLGFDLSEEQKKLRDAIFSPNIDIVFVDALAGSGKAQPKDTIIPTPSGDKRLGDLQVGDFVFDRLGKPTRVLGVFDQGELEAYKMVFSDGRETICNGEHYLHNGYYIDTILPPIPHYCTYSGDMLSEEDAKHLKYDCLEIYDCGDVILRMGEMHE